MQEETLYGLNTNEIVSGGIKDGIELKIQKVPEGWNYIYREINGPPADWKISVVFVPYPFNKRMKH